MNWRVEPPSPLLRGTSAHPGPVDVITGAATFVKFRCPCTLHIFPHRRTIIVIQIHAAVELWDSIYSINTHTGSRLQHGNFGFMSFAALLSDCVVICLKPSSQTLERHFLRLGTYVFPLSPLFSYNSQSQFLCVIYSDFHHFQLFLDCPFPGVVWPSRTPSALGFHCEVPFGSLSLGICNT